MEWWVLLHVATAFWMVAGLVGRDVVLGRARASTDIEMLRPLADTAGVFDRYMVIPGSMAVLVAGLAAALAEGLSFTHEGWMLVALVLYLSIMPFIALVLAPKGKVFDAALADAASVGAITPALRAALDDRAVSFARLYERVVIAVIIVLMVTKPF